VFDELIERKHGNERPMGYQPTNVGACRQETGVTCSLPADK